MNELQNNERVPESGKTLRFKVELHGGNAAFTNKLSDGSDEQVKVFDGSETPLDRRFNHEVVEGEEWFFVLSGGAKAFYR